MDQLINIAQLDFLTKLGREEDTIEILGTKFAFRTLTVDENTQSFETPTKEQYQDDIAKFNAMRIEVLSRAITRINNLVIPDSMRLRVKEILKKAQQLTLNKLFDAYQNLVKKQEDKFKNANEKLDDQVPETGSGQTTPTLINMPPPPAIEIAAPEKMTQNLENDEESTNIVDPSSLMGPKK